MKFENNVPVKGDDIVFIAGKYGGLTGWINTQEEPDDKHMPVIVLKCGKHKSTFVSHSSFRREFNNPPATYAEAVIQQCPEIERSIVNATRQLAKCDIGRDVQGFNAVLSKQLMEAKDWQEKKDSKGMYRKIQF